MNRGGVERDGVRVVVLADGRRYPVAPSPRRLLALIIDLGCVAPLSLALGLLFGLDPFPAHGSASGSLARLAVAVPVLCLVLGVSCWRTNGQTPGKRILGLRAVRRSGADASLRWALWREVVAPDLLFLPSLIPIVGVLLSLADPLWMTTNVQRRTLHDLLADSCVVRDSR